MNDNIDGKINLPRPESSQTPKGKEHIVNLVHPESISAVQDLVGLLNRDNISSEKRQLVEGLIHWISESDDHLNNYFQQKNSPEPSSSSTVAPSEK